MRSETACTRDGLSHQLRVADKEMLKAAGKWPNYRARLAVLLQYGWHRHNG